MAEQIRIPSSTAGITRYETRLKSKFLLRPEHVIFFILLLIAAELIILAL